MAVDFGEDRRKHLELVQGVINRLASCSFQIKGWSVTVITALLGVAAAAQLPWLFCLFGLIPALLFWFLDAYYLREERRFRSVYDGVVGGGSGGTPTVALYEMNSGAFAREPGNDYGSALVSETVLPLHAALAVVVVALSLGGHFLAPTGHPPKGNPPATTSPQG